MKISSSSRKMSVRKPSHLGSKIHPSPGGSSPTRFASIGRTGGLTARFMSVHFHVCPLIAQGRSVSAYRGSLEDCATSALTTICRTLSPASHAFVAPDFRRSSLMRSQIVLDFGYNVRPATVLAAVVLLSCGEHNPVSAPVGPGSPSGDSKTPAVSLADARMMVRTPSAARGFRGG